MTNTNKSVVVLTIISVIGIPFYIKQLTDKVPVTPMDTSFLQNPCMNTNHKIDQDCMARWQTKDFEPIPSEQYITVGPGTSWKDEENVRLRNR